MIKSMTGYGAAEGRVGGRALFLEVKTVNHRYFSFFSKLPQNLLAFESRVQALVKERLSRGQVSVFASWDRKNGGASPLTINLDAARQAAALLKNLQAELGLSGELTLSHLLTLPAVVSPADAGLDEETAWGELRALCEAALSGLDGLRLREGRDLERDLLSRLETMQTLLANVEGRRADILAEQKARLSRRIQELCADAVSSDAIAERVALEIAVFADKCDVSEEVVRLTSHIAKFREMLAEEGAVGRKLDFLIQEMNREVNTIGSKTPHAETSRVVVEMKAELEKIREQVQNIE